MCIRDRVLLWARSEPADAALVPPLPGDHRRRAGRRQAHRVPLCRLLTPDHPPFMTADLMTDAVARLRRWAAARPAAVLLVTRGRAYTYAEMLRRAAAVAAALRAAGGDRGGRVALYLAEYDQFFVCMLGAWLAGAVVVPLHTSLPQADADRLIGKSAPAVLVLAGDDACPGEGPARLVVTADEGDLVDGLRPAGAAAGRP